ncbi:DUF58 domain-containing protein [Dyella sp. A6]|uniref:DUF58 domain-containing protein n=1 Tax=Dyella aluminiiresistens TaxID=3069105 RepID=UPI002E7A4ADB|nr:DUF58 domain-containing protein [Dyella sp. A6]
MSVVLPQHVSGDGRTQASLDELIALRTRVGRPVHTMLDTHAARAGQHLSRLYGRGMDYAESRAYQPGDDVRRLDWRLTARSGRLHTKLFQEEREARLLVLLDTHAGMRFGTRARFKSVQAARAAALAGWHAVRAGERVGLMAFGGHQSLLKPAAGARGALSVCGALSEWDRLPCHSSEPLSRALRRARQVQHGASQVLLISDGWSCDAAAHGPLLDLARHASVRILVVADVLELGMPPAGRYPIEHEGEQRQIALLGERARRDFSTAMGAGPARLQALAKTLALPVERIDTVVDPGDAVTALLRARGRTR